MFQLEFEDTFIKFNCYLNSPESLELFLSFSRIVILIVNFLDNTFLKRKKYNSCHARIFVALSLIENKLEIFLGALLISRAFSIIPSRAAAGTVLPDVGGAQAGVAAV